MSLLKIILNQEADEMEFFAAATCALTLAGLACLSAWIPWAAREEIRRSGNLEEQELHFIMWAAPFIVGVSNLLFAAMVSIRLILNHNYKATHRIKNNILAQTLTTAERQMLEKHRRTLHQARLTHVKRVPGKESLAMSD